MGLHLRAAQELHLISPGGASCPRSYQPVGGEGSEPASSSQALASLTRPSPPRPRAVQSPAGHIAGARGPGILLTLTAAMGLHANICPLLFAFTSFP